MSERKIILPATLMRFNPRMDRSVSLSFETQEVSSEEVRSSLWALQGEFGWLIFVIGETKEVEIPPPPKMDELAGAKSHSQRLRGAIFRWWEQDSNGVPDFEAFYRTKMERLISMVKEKIN